MTFFPESRNGLKKTPQKVQLACTMFLYVLSCVYFAVTVVYLANNYVTCAMLYTGSLDQLSSLATWSLSVREAQALIGTISMLTSVCPTKYHATPFLLIGVCRHS